MTRNTIKIIKNTQTEDFIKLCKKSLKNQLLFCFISIIICLICFIIHFKINIPLDIEYNNMTNYFNDFVILLYLLVFVVSFICTFISVTFLLGNISSDGTIFAISQCKIEQDWITFAEQHTFIPYTIILSKKLELENKEIIEVLFESSELRCKNIKTKEIEIISLNKPFKEIFTILEDKSLTSDEIIIDLSSTNPIAFINTN